MANTYEKIASISTYGVLFYEFTAIPATYTDLMIRSSIRTDRPSTHETLLLQFNSTNSNRTNRRIYAYGTSATADGVETTMYGGQASAASNTASCFGSGTVYITNYTTARDKMSTELGASQSNNTNKILDLNVNRWNDSAAITTIRLTPENGYTIQQYSTADLYGIKKN